MFSKNSNRAFCLVIIKNLYPPLNCTLRKLIERTNTGKLTCALNDDTVIKILFVFDKKNYRFVSVRFHNTHRGIYRDITCHDRYQRCPLTSYIKGLFFTPLSIKVISRKSVYIKTVFKFLSNYLVAISSLYLVKSCRWGLKH